MVLKQSPDDHKVRALLSSPNTLATVLHAILYREFGDPLYSWEPETVGLEVKDTWGIELPAASLDKVCALLAALTSDKFFLDWVSFTAT